MEKKVAEVLLLIYLFKVKRENVGRAMLSTTKNNIVGTLFVQCQRKKAPPISAKKIQ